MNLVLAEWQALVAVAIAVLGVTASLYTAFGSTARRLRSDLASDTKLVAELTGDAKNDLAESITDRSYRLVAATRYPSLTWYEVALVLLLSPVFWWLLSAPNDIRALAARGEVTFELTGPGQLFALFVAFVIYATVVRSWASRAATRVVYIYQRLGDDEARALARLLAFPAYLVPTVFVLGLVAAAMLNIMAIVDVVRWPTWVGVLITAAVLLIAIAVAYRIARRQALFWHIRFYTDIMHIGAGVPRLRPVDLGQTEKDRQRHEEAVERLFPGRRRRAEE
ncbi:hypothetical protein [Nocardioides sp. AE5]|uniref:hypothetical protein n=1 Tax=Nocardioides sp. AE5 TaxID=2962573 RepID=UPI002881C412|nr:hypothetical protein [Nocardioides sp. AE5]MDT0202405.1 hypothetical protein [Nocardioides sp. AE5]